MFNQTDPIQHIHSYAERPPSINVKVIRNTKGYNWEITIQGATDPAEALALIAQTEAQLQEMYPSE